MLAIKTNQEILSCIGRKLKHMRLDCNWTQEELTTLSGVSYATLCRLETTGKGSMANYVKVLRTLGGLDELSELVKPSPISPYELLRLRGKKRERASSVHTRNREH
jgi:putative transcriptional regulator